MNSSSKNLVLVHGFMGSALNWGPIVTRLKKNPLMSGWKIVVPDLLGHGGRREGDALPYETLNQAKLCEDLKVQIQNALAPNSDFIALGHSFGLRPLLGLTLDNDLGPHMKKLIVEDASPEITKDAFDRLHKILSSVPVPFASREDAKASIETLFSHDSRLAAFLFSNIRPSSIEGSEPKVHTWRFDEKGLLDILDEAFKNPLWKEWEAYPNPIVLITGESSDHITPERLGRALARRGSKPISHVQIAQSGHWIHSDQPDVFGDTLVKILTT